MTEETSAQRSTGTHAAYTALGLVVRAVLGQGISLVSLLVLSRELTAPEYALYSVAVTWALTVPTFSMQPLIGVLVRDPGSLDRRRLDAATALSAGVTLVVGAPIVIGILALYPGHAGIVIAGCVLSLAVIATLAPVALLQHDLLAIRASWISLTTQLALQGTVIGAILVGLSISRALVVAFLVAALFANVAAQALHRYRASLRVHWDVMRRLAAPTIGAFVVGGVPMLITIGFVPLVALLDSASGAGYYAWAFSIAWSVQALTAFFDSILVPVFAQSTPDARRWGHAVATRALTAAACFVNLSAVFVVSSLVGSVFPVRWEPALPLLYVLGGANVVVAFTLSAHTLTYAVSDMRRLAVRYVGAGCVAFGSALTLLPLIGPMGAALGNLASVVFLAVVLHRECARLERHTVPTISVVWMLVAGAALAMDRIACINTTIDEPIIHAASLTGWVAIAVSIDRGRLFAEARALLRRGER